MKPTETPAASLADRLRAVLAEEGRPPSRRKLAGWIRSGAVTVDGRTLRNPDAQVPAEARISLDLPAASEEEGLLRGARGARIPAAAPRAAPPPWLLHADRHLVVVDRAGFPSTLAGEAFALAVAQALPAWQEGAAALVAVPDPSRVGSGPVLLATSQATAARLSAAIAAGQVLETLLSLRTPPVTGPDEDLVERCDPAADGDCPAWGLVQRDERPLTPPPAGTLDLVPPHRALLVLKHPKTNRRLVFASDPCASFSAALGSIEGALAGLRPERSARSAAPPGSSTAPSGR